MALGKSTILKILTKELFFSLALDSGELITQDNSEMLYLGQSFNFEYTKKVKIYWLIVFMILKIIIKDCKK